MAILVLLLFGCDLKLKQAIAGYKGNGEIVYRKGPFLGTPGVSIKMPPFNLSEEFNLEYQLTGIPEGDRYIVYLVVPEPCPLNQVLKGSYELQIFKNNFLIEKLTVSNLKELRNSVGGGENRFYFYGKSQFDVRKMTDKWSLKVAGKNNNLTSFVEAFILVTRGGYK